MTSSDDDFQEENDYDETISPVANIIGNILIALGYGVSGLFLLWLLWAGGGREGSGFGP